MNAIAHASATAVRGPKLDNRRVLAGVVDLAIVAAGAAVVLFAGDALSSDLSGIQGALGVVVLGWALYYFFAMESGDGQTAGKKLMKLRVVRMDGSPAGMREIAVRTALRVVDNYLVGLIVMLATGERRQRIGDLAAGTVIVDASQPMVAAAPVVEETAEPAEPAEPVEEAALEAVEDAAPTATITLPSRPAPPTTMADLAPPEAPAATDVPEMRPFPPVAEEAPVVEDEAVEDLPDIASASLQELAQDVAEHSVADAVPVVQPEPEAVEVEPEPFEVENVDDGPVTVKSVDTVSAIDLIMGGADEDAGSDESAPEPEDPAAV